MALKKKKFEFNSINIIYIPFFVQYSDKIKNLIIQ